MYGNELFTGKVSHSHKGRGGAVERRRSTSHCHWDESAATLIDQLYINIH